MGKTAVVGPDDDELKAAARQARAKMRTGQDPTEDELEALRIDTLTHRPALRFVKGDVESRRNSSAQQDDWTNFIRIIRPLAGSVGRIDRAGVAVGTGFLVRRRLVVTNRHVATRLVEGGALAAAVVIHFGLEDEAALDSSGVSCKGLVGLHPTLDLALLELARDANRASPLHLTANLPSPEQPIAVVGYPFPDEDRNPLLAEDVFLPPLGVERVAPGDVEGVVGGAVWHDCSTLGGNSGSPLFARDTGEVVGVHFDGSFLTANKAVPAPDVREYVARVWTGS